MHVLVLHVCVVVQDVAVFACVCAVCVVVQDVTVYACVRAVFV